MRLSYMNPNVTNVVSIAAAGGANFAMRADGVVIGWGATTGNQTTVPNNLTNITGTQTITVTATDSRGKTASSTITVTAPGSDSVQGASGGCSVAPRGPGQPPAPSGIVAGLALVGAALFARRRGRG